MTKETISYRKSDKILQLTASIHQLEKKGYFNGDVLNVMDEGIQDVNPFKRYYSVEKNRTPIVIYDNECIILK